MKRFIESAARDQVALLPECLDDYVDADNTVRVVDVFVDELDLASRVENSLNDGDCVLECLYVT